jgi:hypothetical protein
MLMLHADEGPWAARSEDERPRELERLMGFGLSCRFFAAPFVVML